MDAKEIKTAVQNRYAEVARSGGCGCGGPQDCCSSPTSEVIRLVEYPDLQIDLSGADLGVGCGLPTQSAAIKAGDTVLDLGSGAGLDVFLAARQVGPQGRVIGVDMTPEMITRAQENQARGGYDNVEFRLGEIENLPVEDGVVDVVLSNCVINLVPDKRQVFREIYRVLKPGGRFSISDMVTYGDVPDQIRKDMVLWAGCIAGALDRQEYLEIIRETGFDTIEVVQTVDYDTYRGDGYGTASITVQATKG